MALASRGFAALLKAPPALTRDVAVERDIVIPAPDGTGLLTDLYRARPQEPRPTILMRSPYGRRVPYGAMARLFAERGYHAVVQSTRGTFGSGGQIDFDREATDGRATADWITGQDWSNGEIGSFGSSYLSFTQLALASTRPPQLKAMAIGVWGAERRAAYYPGGSFALDRALGWAYTIGNQERRLALLLTPLRARRELAPAFAHLPLIDADTLALGHPVGYYRDWLTRDQPGDPYWAATDFRPILRDLGIPVTMIAGWYDAFLPYMLTDYQALREGGQPVRLRVGAWAHASPDMARYSFRDALDWFDTHLRHLSAPAPAQTRVQMMGGGGWRALQEWPPPASIKRWHLQPGRALAMAPPPDCEPDRYRYDPADPTPAVGGTSTVNGGPRDNQALERRPDVLTFTSAPVESTLEVIGPVSAELHVTSSRAHTDFFARLCDVDPQGPLRQRDRRAAAPDSRGPQADPHRPLAHRAPVPSRSPDPPPGLQRRSSAIRPQPRHWRAAGHGDLSQHGRADHLPRPRTALRGVATDGRPQLDPQGLGRTVISGEERLDGQLRHRDVEWRPEGRVGAEEGQLPGIVADA